MYVMFTVLLNFTVAALLEGLNKAVPGFTAVVLEQIYDVKHWVADSLEDIHNHTYPHIFRFSLGRDGRCLMQYKQWSHTQWEPSNAPGIVLLKVWYNFGYVGTITYNVWITLTSA